MPLKEVFEDFKRSKVRLQDIHEKTLECFSAIEEIFSDPKHADITTELTQRSFESLTETPTELHLLGDERVSPEDIELTVKHRLTEELYTLKEREQVFSLFCQDPALIFVGQTNCGKSSLINELLGEQKLKLPTSDQPSTARIVRVTYGEKPCLKIQAKNGQIIKQRDLSKEKKIPRNQIELQQSERNDAERLQAVAIVELDNEFLKAGVDIIDSPGRNENDALDNLVKEQLNSSLPLIVYVIDGHNLFTTQDREVLNEIVAQRQELDIFYVVNKLEPEERESSDDDEPPSPQVVSAVQKTKKERVYERLVKSGFLSKGKSMNEHERFHGLSAWKIREFNQQKTQRRGGDPDSSLSEYMDAFVRFQGCLQTFAERRLRERVENVCHVLISVLSRCLDFFIQKANVFRERKDYIMRLMSKVIAEERNLNEVITADLEARVGEIEEALSDTFMEVRDEILREAGTFEYNTDEVTIPKDKLILSSDVIEKCSRQLGKMVTTKLQSEVECKLAMLFQSRDSVVVKLTESIQQIEDEVATDAFAPAAANILTKSLVTNYSVSSLSLLSDPVEGRVARFFKKLLNWCYRAFVDLYVQPIRTLLRFGRRGIRELRMEVEVGSPEWKQNVVSRLLDTIDAKNLGEEIIERLKSFFQECHKDFTADMRRIEKLLKKGDTLKDEQRRKMAELTPSLAKQEMFAYSVMDRFRYGLPKRGYVIKQGAQGVVHICENIFTPDAKPCVVKTVNVPMCEMLDSLALELHNARLLYHENILPLVCAIIDENFHEGIQSVSVISEQMKCDLEDALPTITSLRSRLLIAMEVAKALEYLHQANLMHRDVKLQNVLLDDKNHAKLADFGLSKPAGLVNNSVVGTPTYMAPEMLTSYNKSVDVYAFGMLLWRICEGKGNNPKNVHHDSWPFALLQKNAEDHRTPERLDTFPQSCWEIMQKCWELDSERRPSFDTIVQDLIRVLQDPNIV